MQQAGACLLLSEKCHISGYGPISRADLEVVAAKVANEKAWGAIKRARGLPSSGDIISSAFGASWPLKLGRIDTDTADPPGRIPLADANMPAVTVRFLDNNLVSCSIWYSFIQLEDQ